jgi:hypothetical protein
MEMSLTPEILSAVEKRFGLEAAQAAGMSTSVGGIGPLLRERVIAQQNKGPMWWGSPSSTTPSGARPGTIGTTSFWNGSPRAVTFEKF